MHHYQITKYDKILRGDTGVFLGPDEWTDASEIGSLVGGKILDLQEYLRVENLYIDAVLRLFDASNLSYLRLCCAGLDKKDLNKLLTSKRHLHDSAFFDFDFAEDRKILRQEIPTVIKLILRNIAWARLEWSGKFYAHFGWDYYMYVGSHEAAENIIDEIEASGLYAVEIPDSPYVSRNKSTNIIHIDRYMKTSEYVDEEFEIELPSEYLLPLKNIWGFSSEHPFLGNWKVDPELKDALEEIIDHKFDFDHYVYNLQTAGWSD